MKRTPILCLLVGCLLLLASCKNENKSGLFIPKDAAFVFHINSGSLSSKLTWEEIKKTNWYSEAYEEASSDSFAKKLMDNPEASGLDIKSDFAFFIKKRGRGGFGVFQGGIKDATAFEALAKKMSRKKKTEKDGDWNVIVADNSTVTIWNDSKFAVINDMPMGDMNPMARRREKTRFEADSLKVFVKEVMTLDGDESLFDDERFASIMKEEGDMHLWFNSGIMLSDVTGMLSMMKIGSMLEGNVSAASINFDNGKITAKMKQFYGKEMQKAMDDWKFKNVDAAVLDRIPSENVIGVMAMNMDPKGLKAFLKAIGVDGFANMALSSADLTLDEIISATKGDFVMALTDLQMKDSTISFSSDPGDESMSFKTRVPDVNFLFASSVNNKASFEKLLGTFTKASQKLPVTYQLNNEWFVLGTKPETVNGFVSGGNMKHAFTEKISGHPFGFYLDIQRLLRTNFTESRSAKALLEESAAVWKDLIVVGNEYKDGVASSELVINLVDNKTNSLKQLNQYIERMNAARKANKVAFEDDDSSIDMDADSAVTAPTLEPSH